MAKDRIINDWLEQEVSSEERPAMEQIIAATSKLQVPSKTQKDQVWEQMLSKIDAEGDEKNEIINDWLDQEVSSEERLEMDKIIAMSADLEVPSKTSKDQAWEQMLSKIDTEGDEKERVLVPETVGRRNWISYAISAAAVLLLGLYFFQPKDEITHSTGVGQQQSFTLPDNSVVNLNAGSSISYNQKTWADHRVLELTGEGFFEVEPGSDFVVNTPKGSITVVGTSFNIYARNETLEVSCFEGKVSISNLSDVSEFLEPGMMATIAKNSDRLNIGSFDPEHTATWRIGEFHFDEANLASVIEELERQFDITIDVSIDIAYRTYSGYFNNRDMVEALQLVLTPMGLEYDVNGKKVTVK